MSQRFLKDSTSFLKGSSRRHSATFQRLKETPRKVHSAPKPEISKKSNKCSSKPLKPFEGALKRLRRLPQAPPRISGAAKNEDDPSVSEGILLLETSEEASGEGVRGEESGRTGKTSDLLGSRGIIWDHLRSSGIIWNRLASGKSLGGLW